MNRFALRNAMKWGVPELPSLRPGE